MVVDKPAGVTSIPGPTVQNDTVLNRVKGYLIANNSADLRPHLITRLDRFTGGLLLIAKHHIASSMISQQVQQHQMLKEYTALVEGQVMDEHGEINFTGGLLLIAKHHIASSMISQQVQQHQMLKEYTALVEGQVMDEHGEINKPIGRKDGQAARVIDENGQRALTEYWVEERGAKWTRVRVRLHTGRTHQIRVHFAAIGHSLIGDHLYGGDTSKYDHQLLHASKISFNPNW